MSSFAIVRHFINGKEGTSIFSSRSGHHLTLPPAGICRQLQPIWQYRSIRGEDTRFLRQYQRHSWAGSKGAADNFQSQYSENRNVLLRISCLANDDHYRRERCIALLYWLPELAGIINFPVSCSSETVADPISLPVSICGAISLCS